MTPVQRSGVIQTGTVEQGQVDLDDAAQRAVLAEPFDRLAQAEVEGRRYELGDEVGMLPADGEHRLGLGRVRCHAGFAEHVLARFEGGPRVLEMHVRPGADADRVDGGVGEQLFHRFRDLRNHPFRGDPLARLAGAIDHVDDFTSLISRKPGMWRSF